MRGHDQRNAIIAILSVAIVVVSVQLIRGHNPSRNKKNVSESLHCTHPDPDTPAQATAPTFNNGQYRYDIGPFDESISQGLKIDYSLKLVYCNTPKGGEEHAIVGSAL